MEVLSRVEELEQGMEGIKQEFISEGVILDGMSVHVIIYACAFYVLVRMYVRMLEVY